ncbi:MAG: PAS domain S-box protein [Candidatus Omnitrophica bacterium]|nr:PAS domain S-box protein [Candidatus Omnitrophota bacterium]
MNITPIDFNVLAMVIAVTANLFGFWLSFRTKLLRTGAILISTGILVAITIHAVAEFLEAAGVIPIWTLVQIMPVLVSIGVLLMGAGGLHLLYNVTRPLRIMTDHVLFFSSPDLPFKIEPKIKNLKNEIGDLALAFEKMVNDLKRSTVSRDYFESILTTSSDAFLSIDENSSIVEWNPAAERIFGWPHREAVGKQLTETIIPAQYRARHTAGLKRFLATGEGRVIGKTLELSALHRDGREFPVEITIWRTHIDKKHQFNAFIHDITERKARENELRKTLEDLNKTHHELKQTQNQLVQSEKLASIGHLAAGVAHEINNPVGFISSNMEILSQYLADCIKILKTGDRIKESLAQGDLAGAKAAAEEMTGMETEVNLDHIVHDTPALLEHNRKGIERIQKIVTDLRTFARDGRDEIEYTKLEDVVESILGIVHSELKYKARLEKDYGDTPAVPCNPRKMGQVFLNLIVNALQAIEETGTIGIKTYRQNEFVCVDVRDTGKGIPEDNLTRIFEPIFTTKPVGRGTGLGLSVSYEIVKKHGGDIKVQSRPGAGTTFTVMLPLIQREMSPET